MKNIVHITLAALVMLAVGCKQVEFSSEPSQGVGQEVVVELPALVVEQSAVSKSTATDQVETSRFGQSGVITITHTATEGAASDGEASKASWHEAFTNVWVFQFASNGTKLQARNVGSVAANQPITTTLSLGTGTSIYIIANGPATGLDSKVTIESSLLSFYENFTAAGGDEIRLSGNQAGLDVVMIDGKAQILSPTGRLRTIQLRPNVASVKLDLDISKVVGATLTSVDLYKVPERKYIVTRTSMTDHNFLASWGSRTSAPYSWLIPQNLQGAVSSISSYDQRTHSNAPKEATYLRVNFKYGSRVAVFDLFLGESVKDFNVRNNYLYNIKLSIVGTMDDFEEFASKDGRVLVPLDYTALPSNCYVSYPQGNVYPGIKFNALKKPIAKYIQGNSKIANVKGSNPASATDPKLGDDIVYQSGDKLEVVWQTALDHADGSSSMVIQSADLASDGIAVVQVNGAGNAVLAYKRADGTILWNYHIWSTGVYPFSVHATANPSGNANGTAEGGAQARFMDRNIGALYSVYMQPLPVYAHRSFGLLYQYGRSTPFTGQGTSVSNSACPQIYDKNGNEIAMNNIGGFTVQAEVAVSNVTTAVQNPMNWYYKNIGGGNTWYSFGEVSLWSDYGVNKSIYDPCPYGYRVPKLGSWTGFTAPPFSTAINAGTMAFDTWWPATGWRQGDYSLILRDVGAEGRYWSSSLYASNRSFYLYFSTTLQDGATYYSRSSGFAVRCVQEGY